jgi:hypothetical protein
MNALKPFSSLSDEHLRYLAPMHCMVGAREELCRRLREKQKDAGTAGDVTQGRVDSPLHRSRRPASRTRKKDYDGE